MELFFSGAFILTIWIVCAFINIWCVAAMLFLAFDAAYLKDYESREIIAQKLEIRKSLKLLKGGKDET